MFQNIQLHPSIFSHRSISVSGLNNIYQGSSQSCALDWGNADTNNPSVDISNNYWGGGPYILDGATATGGYPTSPIACPPTTMECTTVDFSGTRKKLSPPSIPVDTTVQDTASCGSFYSIGYLLVSNGVEPQGYDTLRDLIEWCPFWTDTENHSWDAFNLIASAVEGVIGLNNFTWNDFLSFLKQVLWLNPDPHWYCDDVDAMIEAVQDNQGAKVAICRYVLANNKCPQYAADFDTVLKYASIGRYQAWLDSVETKYQHLNYPPSIINSRIYNDSINADTLAHPYDTAPPTLWQDSLEVLMGANAGVQAASPIGPQALLSAQLLENPVKDEIDVAYQMGKTALVTMELWDILGRSVPIANAKYQLEQTGSHNATIPAPNLLQGTYYLRITTDVGDAITLKIVKQ